MCYQTTNEGELSMCCVFMTHLAKVVEEQVRKKYEEDHYGELSDENLAKLVHAELRSNAANLIALSQSVEMAKQVLDGMDSN